MKEINNYLEFRRLLSRYTPAIVCFNDPSDEINQNVIKSVNEICKEFPHVFCYKVDWIMMHLNSNVHSSYHSHFVYKYENRQLDMVAYGISTSELHQLFNYTSQELLNDFRDGLYVIMRKERDLNRSEVNKMIKNKTDVYFDRTKPIFTKPPPVHRRRIVHTTLKSALEYIEIYEKVPYSKPSVSQRKNLLALNFGHNSIESQEKRMDDCIALQSHKKINLCKFRIPSPISFHRPVKE